MLLLVMSLLSFLVVILLGGRVQNLASLNVRWGWLGVVVLLIQVVLFSRPPAWLTPWLETIHIFTYLLLALVLFANLRLPGMKLITLGAVSNFLVISANHGYMPVPFGHFQALFPEAAATMAATGHYHNSVMISAGTKLWWLGDVFYLPRPFPFANVFSVGDALLVIGLFLFFSGIMRKKPVIFSR
jgi:hypothetical protein